MKKKIIAILILLTFVTVTYAAEVKWSAMAENTTVADNDVLLLIDTGTGDSQKITVLNLFDMIDTSLELLTILTNETGTGALVFGTSPTLVTPILGTITSGVGTALTALNGENIQDDTIDDDSIDFSDITFADFDFETAWKMWHSNAAGDVTEITLGANGTFLESNGAAANPAFRALLAGDIPDLSATYEVQLTNEAGLYAVLSDVTNFLQSADLNTFSELNTMVADKTLVNEEDAVTWDALGTFGLGITITTGDPFTLGANRIDNGSDLLDGEMIAADTIDDDSIDFGDVTGVDLDLTDAGAITSTGTITATVGFDIVGAADIDYGSADVLDHTFVTDGTGDAEIVFPNDSIGNNELDWGSMTDLTTDGAVVWGNIAEGELTNSTVIDADIKDDTIQEPALNITNAGAAGVDNYVLSYNHAGTNFTWVAAGAGDMTKAVYDSGLSGGVDVLTTVDSTYASDYVLLIGAAVGTNPPKTDGALTYDATSGTLAATEFSGGGSGLTLASTDLSDTAALLYETELDDFSELDTQIADKALINLADGGTFTGNIIANGNLSVGNAGTTAGVLTLLEDDDDGANFASFMVPALAANTVYTLPPDDGDASEQLQTNGSGVLTWEAAGGAGATAWDDIGDPDAAATVDFVTYTQTIDIGKSDSGGGSGLILDVTGLGAGTDDVIALKITTATDDDTDYIPIEVRDDSGTNDDLLFQVNSTGAVLTEGGVTLSNGATITQSANNYVTLTEFNDTFQVYFTEFNVDLLWSDGALRIRNAEDGVDAIVKIQGKDAGEKGVLRVESDGVDKYIELHHDDTDAQIVSSSGDIYFTAPGGDINFNDDNLTTTGTATFAGGTLTGDINAGGADLELPQGQTPDTDGDIDLDFTDGSVVIQHGSAHAELGAATDVVVGKLIRSFSGTFALPDSLQSEIDQWPFKAIEASEFPHGIVITDIYLKTSASSTYAVNVENWDDPTTINGVNPTIDAITTSASTEVHEDTITYPTIGAGQIIMIDLPTTDISWFSIQIDYYEPIA